MGTVHRRVLAALAALALFLPSTHAAAASNEYGVAVIIGNKEYADDRFSDVSYAHNDAEAFKRFVTDKLGFDSSNVIDLRDATKAEMEAALGVKGNEQGQLWQWAELDGSSDIVVFYSGHGMEGAISAGRRPGYLLPVDANKDRAQLNGYPIELLYENLRKVPSKSVTVYLDACFSGVAGEPVDDASPVSRGADISGVSGVPGFAVLTAASGDQWASWDKEARHGLFTEHLLNGLYGAADADGDRRVTAREAKLHLDRTMTRAARKAHGREQDAGLHGDEGALLSFSSAGGWGSRPLKGGDRFRDCPECPEMVVLPAGSYRMGSTSYAHGRQEHGGTVHEVTIAAPFALGVYEVTVAEFGRFVDETGYSAGDSCFILIYEDSMYQLRAGRGWRNPGFGQSGRNPVVCVNWNDAQAYVAWLSREAGEEYRLPSESEWEYAARAGRATARHWGEGESGQCRHVNKADASLKEHYSDRSWFVASCRDGHVHTAPVGSFAANGWGLHNMLGNVSEWTEDCWNGSYGGAPSDGSAWEYGDCSQRVLRGDSWIEPSVPRAADRKRGITGHRNNYIGFRVARTLAL